MSAGESEQTIVFPVLALLPGGGRQPHSACEHKLRILQGLWRLL
jgi:hypothetical protein